MTYGKLTRIAVTGVLLAVAGLTAACESDAERAARLEREKLIESGQMEDLQNSLETVNPDPYAKKDNRAKGNLGRHKPN